MMLLFVCVCVCVVPACFLRFICGRQLLPEKPQNREIERLFFPGVTPKFGHRHRKYIAINLNLIFHALLCHITLAGRRFTHKLNHSTLCNRNINLIPDNISSSVLLDIIRRPTNTYFLWLWRLYTVHTYLFGRSMEMRLLQIGRRAKLYQCTGT